MDWNRLQQVWDAQQESYLPDREERFTAMLDTVEAVVGTEPRILDLAGGTGSISIRALARFPKATTVIVDIDAALLAIARGTFDGDDRVRVASIDLGTSDWLQELGEDAESFDAVLTATALHWLPAERVGTLYTEVGTLLRPGGVFANADHMADDGLPEVSDALSEWSSARQLRERADEDVDAWDAWWVQLRAEPELADAIAARDAHFADRGGSSHTESTMTAGWHIAALRDGDYTEAGLVWRGLTDAVVVGTR